MVWLEKASWCGQGNVWLSSFSIEAHGAEMGHAIKSHFQSKILTQNVP